MYCGCYRGDEMINTPKALSRMNRNCWRYLSLLIFLLAGGCASDSLQVEDQLPIIPLAVGNQWVWKHTVIDSTNHVVSSTQSTLRIIGDTIINGEQWYIPDRNYYQTNRPDGIWSATKSDPLKSKRDYKHPVNINEVMHSDTVSYGSGPKDYHIYDYVLKEKGQPISVIAGQFAANRYEPVIKNLDGTLASDSSCNCRSIEWFSPGYGLIKVEFYLKTVAGLEYQNYTIELADVVLK
jgi:hypothetical protein